ncbi:hypothetical protein BH11PSE2_BH11PSE2_15930 [soil metagenome]
MWGLVWAAVAIGIRWSLTPIIGGSMPYVVFFPAIVLASAFAGAIGGGVCTLACAGAALALVLKRYAGLPSEPVVLLALPTFVLSSAAVVYIAALMRRAIVEVAEARDQEVLLVRELEHRVKNTLAIVQAVAAQTLKSSPDPVRFQQTFGGRLRALSNAHNLLSATAWRQVTLRQLVEETLTPYVEGTGERLSVTGPDVWLAPDLVVDLALSLNELATNALKHGAWSRDGGRVEVSWSQVPDDAAKPVAFVWREQGGPPAVEPAEAGFGLRLLRRVLGGRSAVDFSPAGLRWTTALPIGAEGRA